MSASGEESGMGLYGVLIVGAVGLVIFSVVMLLGLQVVGDLTAGVGGDVENRSASPDPKTGTWVAFENVARFEGSVEEIFTVRDSRGNAIRLSGDSNSNVQSRETVTVASDDTWTICQWARVRDGAGGENMTALSVAGQVMLQYNGSQGNWSAWYHDAGSSQSFRVNVSAPNQPGNYSQVCARNNGTHLGIYRNNTLGEEINVTGQGSADATVGTTAWNGSLDETRAFDDALNNSQRQALVDAPVGPLPNGTRTLRIMFDEGSGSTTAMYFTSTKADISNGVWVDGLAGNVLTEGSDYDISVADAEIRALDGGRIDGAPVVWIDYEFLASNVDTLVPGIRGGFSAFATGAIVIPAVVVISLLLGSVMAVMVANRVLPDDSR